MWEEIKILLKNAVVKWVAAILALVSTAIASIEWHPTGNDGAKTTETECKYHKDLLGGETYNCHHTEINKGSVSQPDKNAFASPDSPKKSVQEWEDSTPVSR